MSENELGRTPHPHYTRLDPTNRDKIAKLYTSKINRGVQDEIGSLNTNDKI